MIPPEGMRPLQRCCEREANENALLTIIEAPMGEGKTEAALYLAGRICRAYNKRGIYLALPTAATSNQMVGRVRSLLSDHGSGNVRLLHSMAWLVDDAYVSANAFDIEDGQQASDWTKPLRRGMLSENAVGTVDQAMASVLRLKYGMLRLLGLAGKVLIIDEIHAYDIYMSTIIARLLEWCRMMKIPVILLSATMQDRQKLKYLNCYGIKDVVLAKEYPLITQVKDNGGLKQSIVGRAYMNRIYYFNTAALGDNIEEIAGTVLETAKDGGCICVLMNTVRRAQILYRTLRDRDEKDILLFHARFPAARRAEIERNCLELFGKKGKRPGRMILVCTQVVEQSLDVCFDAMITEIAPMDMLLQRAGRVHRHEGNIRPKRLSLPTITVILPDATAPAEAGERYNVNGLIYSPLVLQNTERLLLNRDCVHVPEDVRECVEEAYSEVAGDDLELYIKTATEEQLKVFKAESCIFPEPREDYFFGESGNNAAGLRLEENDDAAIVKGAATRDGDETVRICFLPADFKEAENEKENLRRMMEYSCSIRVSGTGNTEPLHGPITLHSDEDGLYRWLGKAYRVDDEYGIEEVKQ